MQQSTPDILLINNKNTTSKPGVPLPTTKETSRSKPSILTKKRKPDVEEDNEDENKPSPKKKRKLKDTAENEKTTKGVKGKSRYVSSLTEPGSY